MIAPERVAVSSFWRKRSLSDLAVWGFPEFSRKIFPLKPFFHPFHPFFHSSTLPFTSSIPQTPSSNSLEQVSISPFYLPFPLFPPSTLLNPYRPLSEHLRNPSIGPPNGLKQPFLGLFRGIPKTPKKGLKTPFLTPFSPLPYPL